MLPLSFLIFLKFCKYLKLKMIHQRYGIMWRVIQGCVFVIFELLVMNFVPCGSGAVIENRVGVQLRSTTSKNTICKTRGCKSTVKTFQKNIDQSVNPCENFYQFACGKYVKETVIPVGSSGIDSFSSTGRTINGQLKKILKDKVKDDEPRSFKLLQDYYKVCMDTDQMNRNGENDLKGILKELGGWPILEGESWKEAEFNWNNTIYSLRKTGYAFAYFISITVADDENDLSKKTIYIDQPLTVVQRERLLEGLENPIVQAYYNFMVDYAVLFGANRRQAKNELLESLKFEFELAKIISSSHLQSPNYTKMSIKELEAQYTGIPWLEYINNVLNATPPLSSTYEVYAGPNTFLKNIGSLVAKTPKRVLANYVMWGVAFDSANKLNKKVRDLRSRFNLAMTGNSNEEERWKICINEAKDNMNIALSSLYVRRYFNEKSKAEATALLNDIRSSFKYILERVKWMDEKTKAVALDKLASLQGNIAYPDELLDNGKVDEIYEGIKINAKSFLKTQLTLYSIGVLNLFATLQMPNVRNWISQGSVVDTNALYNLYENNIRIPAGILQGLFFANDRTKYLNYGSIGFLMGHEITHGFDEEGSNYDKNGYLRNWWSPSTKQMYQASSDCVIVQYGNITVKEVGMNLNGELTKYENIADIGGYKIAYLAYLNWIKKNSQEPRLKSLPYTARQLFWISAANIWCTKSTLEDLRDQVATDKHSPEQFRVNIPFSNIPEFAKDYNCPVGSLMNPVNKCSVW